MQKSYDFLPINTTNTITRRLAIDAIYKGNGLGELILIDALKRSYESSINSIGSIAIIISPINEDAVKFYEKYGFILLPDSRKMFIPMGTIFKLFTS